MKRKNWSVLLIVLGVVLIGLAGYAMEAWGQAVEIWTAMGLSESMLEEVLRQPGAAELMAQFMPSGGEFWYYVVIYRVAIMVAGIVSIVAGVFLWMTGRKQEEPAVRVERNDPPADAGAVTFVPANNFPAPAAPSATRTLQGKDGVMAGRSFTIKGKVTIGRSTSRCQIIYPSDTKGVSGVHCTVRFNGTTVTVTDENSSYGTYIDGVRLTPGQVTTMHRGQLLQLGSKKECLQLRS